MGGDGAFGDALDRVVEPIAQLAWYPVHVEQLELDIEEEQPELNFALATIPMREKYSLN